MIPPSNPTREISMIDNLECPSHLEQIRNRAAEKDRDRAIAEMSEWVKRSAIAEMSEWVKRSNRQVNTIDGLNKELEAAKAEIQRLRDYLSTADEADGPLMYTSVFRQHLGDNIVDSQFAGYCLGRRSAISSHHHDPDVLFVQLPNGLRGGAFDRICDTD